MILDRISSLFNLLNVAVVCPEVPFFKITNFEHILKDRNYAKVSF